MIIFDTNIWTAALRSPSGASHFILRGVLTGEILAGASVALFLEYEDVLKRTSHLQASGLNIAQVNTILAALAKQLVPVHNHYRWRPVLKDPKDEMVLEAAMNGGAKTIISFNLKDFKGAEKFGVEVIQPGNFVRRLKQ